MKIQIDSLCFHYGRTPVLRDIALDEIPAGQVTALIGPNAAGKSTLLKCIAGLLKPAGRILFDGRPIDSFKGRTELARVVSYLPQEAPSTAALTVFEAVLLARQHRASWIVSDEDLAQVARVLAELRLEHLALRFLNELSGGQRQLVAVAQALAREPRVLLLDEPTSSLDLQRQLELLSLMRAIAAERAVTVLIAVHDLNLAARFSDWLVVLHEGAVYAAGAPSAVLTELMFWRVYGVEARVSLDASAIPQVVPLRSIHGPAWGGVQTADVRSGQERGAQ